MKHIRAKILAMCASIVLVGCSSNESILKISVEEAYKIMLEEEVIVVDVRTQKEFNEGHIENAINIPLDEITTDFNRFDKDEKILLYCKSGNRSAQAAKRMSKLGYTSLYDFGGIQDWTYGIIK